jgi:hypothetical protein
MITLTLTHLTRYDSSGWVISPKQRPLPDKHNNTHRRHISMLPAEYKPIIPASMRSHTHAIYGAAAGIGLSNIYWYKHVCFGVGIHSWGLPKHSKYNLHNTVSPLSAGSWFINIIHSQKSPVQHRGLGRMTICWANRPALCRILWGKETVTWMWTVMDRTPMNVGPCHHGMARPQVADRGTASNMYGSCE